MKTDLKLFKELYLNFDIKLKEIQEDNYLKLLFGNESYDRDVINNEKFGGFNSFYTVVYFDLNGRFIKQDFIE